MIPLRLSVPSSNNSQYLTSLFLYPLLLNYYHLLSLFLLKFNNYLTLVMYFGVKQLTNISCVCKEWYSIGSQNIMWSKWVDTSMIEKNNENKHHFILKEVYVSFYY